MRTVAYLCSAVILTLTVSPVAAQDDTFDDLLAESAPSANEAAVAENSAAVAEEPQAVSEPEPKSAKRRGVIEEVVVTARKRDESLIDTTYSVYAITGDKLEEYNASNFNVMAESVPGLTIGQSDSGVPAIVMRGIGTVAATNLFDMTVGLAMDGVYYGNAQWFQGGLLDLAQIEILRGPQGVDFGKNTTAGMISMTTQDPGDELEMNLRALYEQETQEKLFEFGIGGPLTETLGGRLVLQSLQNTGYIKTIFGADVPDLERLMARGTLVWEPNESITARYKVFYSDSEIKTLGTELIDCTPEYMSVYMALGATDDCKADDFITSGELIGGIVADGIGSDFAGVKAELVSHTLGIDWQIGDLGIVSTTGYQTIKSYNAVDADNLDIKFIDAGWRERFHGLTQEVRFNLPLSESIDSGFGFFYEDSYRGFGIDVDIAEPLPGSPTGGSLAGLLPNGGSLAGLSSNGGSLAGLLEVDTETYAFFGEVTIDMTRTLNLNLGARYSREFKQAEQNNETGDLGDPKNNNKGGELVMIAVNTGDIDNLTGSRVSRHLDSSAVLQWDYIQDRDISWLDSGQMYLSYKEGYKSGGFDVLTTVDPVTMEPVAPFIFADETVQGYELGTKIEALDQRLRASVALFYSQYENLQVQYQSSEDSPITSIVTVNAGSSFTRGIEGDMTMLLSDTVSMDLSAAYTEAEYKQFTAPCYPAQSEAQGCVNGEQELAGTELSQAPNWSGSIALSYDRDITDSLRLKLGTQASYTGDYLFSSFGDPDTARDDLWLVNGRASVSAVDGSWDIALIGRNLLDTRSLSAKYLLTLSTTTTPEASYIGARTPPRTIAVQFTKHL